MRARCPSGLVLLVILFSGCSSVQEERSWPDVPVTATPEVFVSGLLEPTGLSRFGDGLVVADRGSGEVLFLDSNFSLVEVLAEGLDEPARVLATADGVVVSTEGTPELWLVEANQSETLLWSGDGLIVDMGWDGEKVWFVSSAGENSEAALAWVRPGDGAGGTLTTLPSEPGGIALAEEELYLADVGRGQVFSYDLVSGEEALLASPEEVPRDVAVDEGMLFVSARSERWPGGGWVYALEASGGSLGALSYSPPGLDRLWVDGPHVYWASGQSITRVSREGGTYEMLAAETRVGDFLVQDGWLLWTDRDRGEVLGVLLAE